MKFFTREKYLNHINFFNLNLFHKNEFNNRNTTCETRVVYTSFIKGIITFAMQDGRS